ncbi:hypothetical protein QBC40DRAFT_175450 [Triangularia verruculosa]|uniref:DUF3669 domain-containing protein n=1 Tax=Triangularia verruculosa TaxID=2587418 RepID=A0AAN6XFR1_9PEZI|nr:hypothetical protein QBC40DRAFT_175450 [Triangularia verruculosa]
MLSLETIVSTASSEAKRHAAVQKQGTATFRKIGAGACGAIFAQDGKSLVIKLGKTTDHASLWNDYKHHTHIEAVFDTYGGDSVVKIPECYYFVPHELTDWFDLRPGLVHAAQEVCHLPTAALVAERILPLPEVIRVMLIERYCPPRIKQAALIDPANKDCLIRPYLGSNKTRAGIFFSLRNFKLHLNQMVEIGVDIAMFNRKMAVSMAIMHWAARVDARDAEFVIGSSTAKSTPAQLRPAQLEGLTKPTYTGPSTLLDEDFFQRSIDLCIMDFNQVRSITLDEAGVALAVEAVKLNDPYLPRPGGASRVENDLWVTFVASYIAASDSILAALGFKEGGKEMMLPRQFIRGMISLYSSKLDE